MRRRKRSRLTAAYDRRAIAADPAPRPPHPSLSLDRRQIRQGALLREDSCRAASFKAENSYVSTSHLAVDPDGTFAMPRMQPWFQVAVKIATVVAAPPRGGSDAGRLASTAAWAGLG